RLSFCPVSVLVYNFAVRKSYSRIFINHLHVRVGRRIVEVIENLFNVFAVVTFVIAKPEKTFFNHVVLSVPERKCKTEPLFIVADARNAVFIPAVGPADRLVVCGVSPRISVLAIIFTYCSPLAVTYIWP